jgi:hypothetical protein
MTTLRRVLDEIQTARGPVSLSDLSLRLGIERSALEGMLQFWIRKGRLKEMDAGTAVCLEGDCTGSCRGIESCPLLTKLPRTITLASPATERD